MRKPTRIYYEKFFAGSDRYYATVEDNSGSCEGVRLATSTEVSEWRRFRQSRKPNKK